MTDNLLRQPARDVPVLGEYDVVVCGGGPAFPPGDAAPGRRDTR